MHNTTFRKSSYFAWLPFLLGSFKVYSFSPERPTEWPNITFKEISREITQVWLAWVRFPVISLKIMFYTFAFIFTILNKMSKEIIFTFFCILKCWLYRQKKI